jgi:hypothetical protein
MGKSLDYQGSCRDGGSLFLADAFAPLISGCERGGCVMILLAFEDLPSSAAPKQSTVWPYVIAVVLMGAFGVIAVLLLTKLRPVQDNSMLIATVLGFLGTMTGVILTFMKAQDTHDSVNGQLKQFLSTARQVAHFEGQAQGRAEGIAEGELRHPTPMQAVIPVVLQPAPPAPALPPAQPAPTVEPNKKETS